MKIVDTEIPEVKIIEPDVFGDNRGWFFESYNKQKLAELGIDVNFVQDNHSFSAEVRTLRGIHFQNNPKSQAKLIRCTAGRVLDIAVDLRKNSPTYKKSVAVELSAENKKQFFIPKGFGHGFLTLTDNAEFQYKVDEYYSKDDDRSIRFDDSELAIDWKTADPILSDKDKNAPTLKDSDCNF
ncbi:MAG: dTDP-4-dehydrorhamnose 3,5-epimerase [Candidatus Berkelbacteria bacterium]|nr:dTDP-4-dehydrorhamnose 3,5-epimerase [Candidatus Berkelbacteria bacterium]